MRIAITHLDHPRRGAPGAGGASWTAPVGAEAGCVRANGGIGRSYGMDRVAGDYRRFAQQEQYDRGAGMGPGGRTP